MPDSTDACPDQPGAPSPDPKKNGCPSLAVVKNGMIVILQPVFFATDKDVILPKSFPLLGVVKDVFVAQPEIKKVEVQGHTDARGKYAHNMDLSQRRAQSVVRWLAAHGVAADRMVAKGYGPNKPVASNQTNQGRSLNRRVEFHIIDPAPGGAGAGGTSVQVAPPGGTVPGPGAGAGGTQVVAPADQPQLDAEGGARPGRFVRGQKGKKGGRAGKLARILGKGKKKGKKGR